MFFQILNLPSGSESWLPYAKSVATAGVMAGRKTGYHTLETGVTLSWRELVPGHVSLSFSGSTVTTYLYGVPADAGGNYVTGLKLSPDAGATAGENVARVRIDDLGHASGTYARTPLPAYSTDKLLELAARGFARSGIDAWRRTKYWDVPLTGAVTSATKVYLSLPASSVGGSSRSALAFTVLGDGPTEVYEVGADVWAAADVPLSGSTLTDASGSVMNARGLLKMNLSSRAAVPIADYDGSAFIVTMPYGEARLPATLTPAGAAFTLTVASGTSGSDGWTVTGSPLSTTVYNNAPAFPDEWRSKVSLGPASVVNWADAKMPLDREVVAAEWGTYPSLPAGTRSYVGPFAYTGNLATGSYWNGGTTPYQTIAWTYSPDVGAAASTVEYRLVSGEFVAGTTVAGPPQPATAALGVYTAYSFSFSRGVRDEADPDLVIDWERVDVNHATFSSQVSVTNYYTSPVGAPYLIPRYQIAVNSLGALSVAGTVVKGAAATTPDAYTVSSSTAPGSVGIGDGQPPSTPTPFVWGYVGPLPTHAAFFSTSVQTAIWCHGGEIRVAIFDATQVYANNWMSADLIALCRATPAQTTFYVVEFTS